MPTIHAATALLTTGLADNVRVALVQGRIATIDVGVQAQPGDERIGLLLPGMASLHSHAFQRCMAGLAEMRGSIDDSFWTWRETMYRFALAVTPDQLEAVAAQLYVEMLESGFTRVGEFHYLHHDHNGRPYDDIAEMAGRICAAAATTGIGMTLLPTFYAHSTFGGAPPILGQRRFINDLDSYGRLHEGCRRHAATLDNAIVGVAPHSLRAVTPTQLAAITALAPGKPLHIHAAEQTQEIADCIAWSGKRPVEWLLDNAGIDERWCIIHATHMTDSETQRLAASRAVAGVCPITEANLGDGIFSGRAYLAAGGHIGIGTDSNVLIGVADEIRQLEYSQRLHERARNVLSNGTGSTGQALFEAVRKGGARALGIDTTGIDAGAAADLVAIDLSHAVFAAAPSAQLLDAWIFASRGAIDRVWVGGRKLVDGGRHIHHDAVEARFGRVMKELRTK